MTEKSWCASHTFSVNNPSWLNSHFLPLPGHVSAELCPSLCDCITWQGFCSVSQKGSHSLILLHIYKSNIYLCFLLPVFCSVNFHMLPNFLPVTVCASVCVWIGKRSVMSGMMPLLPWKEVAGECPEWDGEFQRLLLTPVGIYHLASGSQHANTHTDSSGCHIYAVQRNSHRNSIV